MGARRRPRAGDAPASDGSGRPAARLPHLGLRRLPAAGHAVVDLRGRARGHPPSHAPHALHRGAAPGRPRAPAGRPARGRRGRGRARRARVFRGRAGPRQPRAGQDPGRGHSGMGERVRDPGEPRAHGRVVRLDGPRGMARALGRRLRDRPRVRPGPHPVAGRPDAMGDRSLVARVAGHFADPGRGPPGRARVRGHGGPRPSLLLQGRHADRRGVGRGVPAHRFAHHPRHPPPHDRWLRAGGGTIIGAAPAVLRGTLRLDAGRHRDRRSRGLRRVHDRHRRLGPHHHGPRGPHAAHAGQGRLPGRLLARAGDRVRKPRPAVPPEPARDPVRHRGRGARGRAVPGRPPARPPARRPRLRVRRARGRALGGTARTLLRPGSPARDVGGQVGAEPPPPHHRALRERQGFDRGGLGRGVRLRGLGGLLRHAGPPPAPASCRAGGGRRTGGRGPHPPDMFLLVLNLVLLVLGSVLEIYSAIIILVPLVIPMGRAFEVDPIHLGVIFLANLELGFLLPPVGLNLFLSAARFGKPLPSLYRQVLPFLLILGLGVLLITYVPDMSLGILKVMGKR
ncbi:MAG: hypothetical protein DMF77_16170 [Acidobacteria bacterium]|nr:MAG: hypothetical protein DMF77_16170 [Acidobacteriota bacterium]